MPDMNESQMQCLSKACEGCGICIGICPANAIMLEKTEEPSPCLKTKEPSPCLICCENSGGVEINDDKLDKVIVPCGGLIDIDTLTDKLYNCDKILSVVCPDDACRHFNGNKRACIQTKRLKAILEAAGLKPDSVKIIQASHAMPQVLRDEIQAFLMR